MVARDKPTSGGDPSLADLTAVLRPPAPVLDIASRLEEAGFETWCVGGAVRDALLGHRHADWDLATAARPDQIIRLFRRTVPVGIPHGTVGVLDREGTMHEITTFRRDVRTDGRHAEVEFGASLDEDLARRDFTINAIAYSPSRRVLYDPFDGRGDLARGVVRAVGIPDERMREDRLRALRAIRFAARFGFTIEEMTWEAIVASAPFLTRLSAERVREELTKTMEQVAQPSQALALWLESGALGVLVPALGGGGIDATILRTLDCLPAPAAGQTVGSPAMAGTAPLTASRTPATGVVADRAAARGKGRRLARLAALFMGVSDDAARRALRALRFSNAETEWVAGLVAGWQSVGRDMEGTLVASAPIPDAAIRRWVAAVGRLRVTSLLRIAAARWAAMRAAGESAPSARRIGWLYRRAVRSAFHDPVDIGDLAVNGDDLVAAGIAPGPRIGEILRQMLAIVLADPAQNSRALLLARVAGQGVEGGPPAE